MLRNLHPAVFFAVLAAAFPLMAEQVQDSAEVLMTRLSWTKEAYVAKFDPALGRLESVEVRFTGKIRGDIQVESKSGLPATVTTYLRGTITLRRPDNTDILTVEPEVQKTNNFTAYDGAVDYGGTSGATYLRQAAEKTDSFSTTDPADLELFTATEPGSGEEIGLLVNAVGRSAATGAGNLSTRFRTEGGADITVIYTYRATQASPVSLGDTVWLDSNANGIQEPEIGELPIDGVTLTLSDPNNPVGIATTDTVDPSDSLTDNFFGSGYYAFWGLLPGTYTVTVDASNFSPGAPLEGLVPTYDLDGGLDNTATFDLLSDTRMIDFGYVPMFQPGTGTPGYWKNHPNAWPVETIEIGGITYTKGAAIWAMGKTSKDMTFVMFAHLVCAKLNVGIGNDASCIADWIRDGDAWMAENPLGSRVSGSSPAWAVGEPIKDMLDAYNNGTLCAPHRD